MVPRAPRSPPSWRIRMSDIATDSAEDPEVRKIRHLVRLMHRYDLTAIDLDEGQTRIRLRRRGVETVVTSPATLVPSPPTPISVAQSDVARATVSPPPSPPPAGTFIPSPMIGTFY